MIDWILCLLEFVKTNSQIRKKSNSKLFTENFQNLLETFFNSRRVKGHNFPQERKIKHEAIFIKEFNTGNLRQLTSNCLKVT